MPLYEFDVIREGRSIGVTQIPLAVCDRDNPPPHYGGTLVRRQVPSRISIVGLQSIENRTASETLNAYRRVEQRIGTTAMRQRIGHHPEQVKRAWGNDAPPADYSKVQPIN